MTAVVQVLDVVQEYPGVRALKGVSLDLAPGQVLGLVGENGAGKSTLIRILGGIEQPVSGRLVVRGEDRTFRGSAESQAAGISVVSQEFRLVPQLSVADNVFLGHESTRAGVVDAAGTRARTAELLDQLGLDLDPDRPVSSLTVGDRQMVEIARALSREFDVLIMDEPTAALNGAEILRLHAIVRRIAEQGKAVVYVSHHLDEIFEICHDVAVLRDGSLVAHAPTADLDEARLVEHMLGRAPQTYERGAVTEHAGEERLTVRGLRVPGVAEPFDLSVRAGEIVGLAGLVGSGRAELTRALFGDLPATSGEVRVDGRAVRLRSSREAVRHGIFMLSEDRKGEGILPHLDVTENAMVSRDRSGLGLLRRLLPVPADESAQFERLRTDMRIRVPHGRQLIGNLSGGNQQKVLLGRALLSGCAVLLLNEPTRGVDVGAKVDIYQLVKQLAEAGVAVVVSSSDAPELAAITDRCAVYFAGRQVAELHGRDVTEDNIVSASVGQTVQEGSDV
ncbi:sugar ABC transporter ATP-binding protein [Cellulomonas sp. Sa3CUA2]|uniref:Sugar ABC transporter ATP-binding protein n=1 Tax=Cellulomonas avistercoris TaxID=2762242 RepID=A0ABR8QHQ0_9CELL|nr:sugar ABC transporter ATP-binding protein [Cellulomonas avistercoris]MBD7919956.1 sugar ABC transporter ATP-binding protein [Cellulomonas avistercoris]